jgi:ubiquinone biosynthesis monooxygenase Coq7
MDIRSCSCPRTAPDRRILRVNDAGERGGVAMYQAQMAVARWRCPELLDFLQRTRDHEADHARRFRALMPTRGAKVCRLPWVWTLGGAALGLITALLGPRAVCLCTEAVERSVHAHLDDQLQWLIRHDAELAAVVRFVRDEEAEHLAEATRLRATRPAPSALAGARRASHN